MAILLVCQVDQVHKKIGLLNFVVGTIRSCKYQLTCDKCEGDSSDPDRRIKRCHRYVYVESSNRVCVYQPVFFNYQHDFFYILVLSLQMRANGQCSSRSDRINR
jgi:hypothetical protein